MSSIFLHCDWKANYLLRQLLNIIYGSRKHDTIYWYSRDAWIFNKDDIRIPYKRLNSHKTGRIHKEALTNKKRQEYLERGKIPNDWWSDFTPVGRLKKELTGYPTQKPISVLRRIILAASNNADNAK